MLGPSPRAFRARTIVVESRTAPLRKPGPVADIIGEEDSPPASFELAIHRRHLLVVLALRTFLAAILLRRGNLKAGSVLLPQRANPPGPNLAAIAPARAFILERKENIMAEKVALLGVAREEDFMYYVADGAVWKVRRSGRGVPKGTPERVADGDFEMDANYVYFIDGDGDAARALPENSSRQSATRRRKPVADSSERTDTTQVCGTTTPPLASMMKLSASPMVSRS